MKSFRCIAAIFVVFNVAAAAAAAINHVYGEVEDSYFRYVSVPRKDCYDGFNYDERICEKNSIDDSSKICPTGYSMVDGGRCVRMYEDVETYCPEGCEKIKDECIRIQERRPLDFCPKGSVMMPDGMCYVSRREKPLSVCLDGSIPNKKGCLKLLEAKPSIHCSKGYFKSSDGECEITSEPNISCPSGYNIVSMNSVEQCIKIREFSPVPICKEGFKPSEISSGKCVKKTYSFPVESCPYGFKFVDGKCLKTIEDDVKFVCENKDLTMYRGKCVKVRNVSILCPDGRYSTSGLCDQYEEDYPQPNCKEGSMLINGECIRSVLPSQNDCPSGLRERKTGECKKIKVILAYCEIGRRDCVNFEIRSPERWCKRRLAMRMNGPSSERTRRLMYTDIEKCSEVIKASPKMICPEMYNLNLAKTECIKDVETRATFVCPSGCTLDVSGKRCEKTLVGSPNVKCPPGYKKTIGNCAKRVSVEPSFFCPMNYKLLNGVCVKNLNSLNSITDDGRSGFPNDGNSLNPVMNRRGGGASSFYFS